MPNPASSDINFIPSAKNTEPEVSNLTKNLLNWSVHAGKKIIILTQIIVIVAIFFSYKLDRDLVNIANTTKTNQTVIAQDAEFEAIHRDLISDLNVINQVISSEIDWRAKLEELNSQIPQNMVLTRVTYGTNTVSLDATVKSAEGFGLYLQTLLSNPNIRSIVLRSSRFNVDKDQYEFGIQINYINNE